MIEIEENERIQQVIHRHWFILLGDLVLLVVALAIPMVLLFGAHLLPIEDIFLFTGSTAAVGAFFLFAWLLFIWMMGWKIWVTYYLDTIIITDKRVFDIDQKGLFSRESGSFRIDRIQNITVNQKGLIQTVLDFGSIRFETAGGNDEDFVAQYISQPYAVKKLINQMQDGSLDKTQEVHLHADSIQQMANMNGPRADLMRGNDYRGGKLGDSEGI
jgi:uncharacterized membrane protein YdbT with pleckstrin-like domain